MVLVRTAGAYVKLYFGEVIYLVHPTTLAYCLLCPSIKTVANKLSYVVKNTFSCTAGARRVQSEFLLSDVHMGAETVPMRYHTPALEGSETDKYNSHNRPFLQDFDKLYDRSIAYLIFEINFNTRCYYLKIYLEDFLKSWPFLLASQYNNS